MSHIKEKPEGSVLDRLRAAGCRITPPRRAVLEVFSAGPHHLNPDEVLIRARKLHPRVGRATVYRTLELLTRLGITRPLPGRDGKSCFTRIEKGHQHVVCSNCDRVVELAPAPFSRLAREVTRRTGFVVHSQLLEFFGLCQRCQHRAQPHATGV
jgi:Fur family ferric uptake transcriptional regulator